MKLTFDTQAITKLFKRKPKLDISIDEIELVKTLRLIEIRTEKILQMQFNLRNKIDIITHEQTVNNILKNEKKFKPTSKLNSSWSKEDELKLLHLIKTKGLTNYEKLGRSYAKAFNRTKKAIAQKARKLVPKN